MKAKCPQCGSSNVLKVRESAVSAPETPHFGTQKEHSGPFRVTVNKNEIEFLTCKSCGYDELVEETFVEGRTSQREKGRYTPYKAGGKGRTRK